MSSTIESGNINNSGSLFDSVRATELGQQMLDGNEHEGNRPVRCGCGKWLSPQKISYHNAKAHKVKCATRLVRRQVECPFCHQRVGSDRFLRHLTTVHAIATNGRYSQLPVPAIASFYGLKDAVIVDARMFLGSRRDAAAMKSLLDTIHLLINNDQPFLCILDRAQSSRFAHLGLQFMKLFDWLPNDYPLRFSMFDTADQAEAFVEKLATEANLPILDDETRPSTVLEIGSNDFFSNKSWQAEEPPKEHDSQLDSTRELNVSSSIIAKLMVKKLQKIRSGLKRKGETEYSLHLASSDSSRLMGAKRKLNGKSKMKAESLNRKHLWVHPFGPLAGHKSERQGYGHDSNEQHLHLESGFPEHENDHGARRQQRATGVRPQDAHTAAQHHYSQA